MGADRLRDFFRLENLGWFRILWILITATFGGWLAVSSPGFVEYRDLRIYDRLLRYNSAEVQFPVARIVAGGASLGRGPSLPWSRTMYADLVERLKGARLVVLDIPLEGTTSPEEDEVLIRAVREHGRVIGRAQVLLASPAGGHMVEGPFPALSEAFRRVGVDDQMADGDGVYRKALWGLEDMARMRLFLPSLALAVVEELEPSVASAERGDRLRVRLPWKTIPLGRTSEGFFLTRLNHPEKEVPVYEYLDVLEGNVPESRFKGAVVWVSAGDTTRSLEEMAAERNRGRENRENLLLTGYGKSISKGEYSLHAVISLMSPFTLVRIFPAGHAVLTFLLVVFASITGFVHFKKSLVFLILLLGSGFAVTSLFFLKAGVWIPVIAPMTASLIGYVGGQCGLFWHLEHEWNVRSLSIRPLLELAQKSQSDFDEGLNFDDYLRSMWNDIEEKTGVELKSTRISENFSLVRSYLDQASRTHQQGQEFLIIHNAADTSPRHRMLLPLPFWGGDTKKSAGPRVREYSILAWDGRIPLETLTSLAALTLFAAVHFHAMEESHRRKDMLIKTIEAIMMAVEAKDTTTSEHSRRVAAISQKLAQWMKLPPQEVDDIYFSAIIHDIGKLGIADSILNKPGKLNNQELAEMRRHPLIGESIMRPVELPEYVMSGILQHHERHDGKGYPHGIPGNEMTMAGKIIKVADVFDALVNRRQYKEPWTEEKVRNLLLELRGTEFDPQIVDVFIRNLYQTKNNPMFYYGIQL
ncbi:MAG: CHASE2 domain-containing protein [Synergistaceae bacterium]|jgi:HD-GYP domain-containing protein (c-di-GMP phosphodiesterase class II)/CHASE2 domain-containing sensor protein|nr:CHASE2 domain-containing protein [Synergistaceae bacterium]